MLSTGGMSHHLIEVLFLSNLGLGPLQVEVGANLGKGPLRYPHLLFPHSEGLLPLHQLHLLREKQFLQLHDHCRQHHYDGVGGHKMHIFTANIPTFHT
jgi:hypothetical protein